jgi:hypothetical protein
MTAAKRKIHYGSIRPINVVILLLIIFNSGGVNIFEHFYITIVTLCLLTFKLILSRRFSINLLAKIMIPSICLMLFNYLATFSWGGLIEYTILLSYIVTAALLLVLYRTSNDDFTSDLSLALKIILIHSLIAFLFQFVGKPLLFAFTDRTKTFLYLFYYVFDSGADVARNQGIFWEPGVLQIFLNILVYISLFVRRNSLLVVMASVAILTTYSSAGYLVLAMLLLIATYKNMRRSYWSIIGMATFIPLAMVVAYGNVHNKFTGNSAKSADVRMFDLVVGTKLLMEHPLLGVGLDQTAYKQLFFDTGLDSIKEYGIAESELEGKGITNSVLFVATVFGLPLALMIFRLLYKQTLLPGPKGLLFLIFILCGFSEPIFNTSFFALFFISGFINMTPYQYTLQTTNQLAQEPKHG